MNRKLSITLLILMITTSAGVAIAANNKAVLSSHPISDSSNLKPTSVQSKRSVVKLYPNPSSNGIIKVSTTEDEELHFYVFDLEGVMIAQKFLKNKQLYTISNLKKGIYLYDVFRKDEGIEQGRIVVK